MGLCLTILFFIKLNYFVLAVSFLPLAAGLQFLNVRRGLACVLSAPVFLVLILASTGIPLRMMVEDCLLMTRAQNTGFRLGILAIHAAKNAWLLPVLLLITWEQTSGRGEETAGRWTGLRAWLLPLALFAGGLCLLASNCQVGEMPLLGLAALCGAEMIRRQAHEAGNDPVFTAWRNLAAFCLLLFFLWPTLGTDVKALRNCAFAVIKKEFVSSETLKTTHLRDLRFSPDGTRALYSREYMEFLDEGIQLVRRHQGTEMRLMVALFSDPFNVALGLPPPTGGYFNARFGGHVQVAASPPSHAPLRRLLGNSTHILMAGGLQDLKQAFGAEWEALRFDILEETKHLTLLRVRQPPSPSPAR